jgi:hypothetical protein
MRMRYGGHGSSGITIIIGMHRAKLPEQSRHSLRRRIAIR